MMAYFIVNAGAVFYLTSSHPGVRRLSQMSVGYAVVPFPLERVGFDALPDAAAFVCKFALQRSPGGGAPPDFSYYGLTVEPVSKAQADALTSGGARSRPALAADAAVASLPFKGGIFAYLPYGGRDDTATPAHVFWLVRELLILDHRANRAYLSAASMDDQAVVPDVDVWVRRLGTWDRSAPPPTVDSAPWTADTGYDEYCAGIGAIQARIAAREIGQAIFSLGLSKPTAATDEQVFGVLRRRNASPHVFLVRRGDAALVGASPAMHLRHAAGQLTVETDAGTRALGATEVESQAIERELLGSEKDLEEQRMIVEETIEDLAAIASGPVEVPVRLEVRRLGSVMHLFTVLQARIAAGVTPLGAVLSCFPPAAVTGTPRQGAMAVIRAVEGTDRGPYGGVLGLIGFDGAVDTAIILRSAWLQDGLATMRCGGGITHASVAADEYAECMNKARSIQACVAEAEGSPVA